MSAIYLLLYVLALGCLLGAAFGAKAGRVQLGWLGMAFWIAVAILRAAGVS